MFYAQVPDFVTDIKDVENIEQLRAWFDAMPQEWQIGTAVLLIGFFIGMFILIYGAVFK